MKLKQFKLTLYSYRKGLCFSAATKFLILGLHVEIVWGPVLYVMLQNFDFTNSNVENAYLYKYIRWECINDFKVLFC